MAAESSIPADPRAEVIRRALDIAKAATQQAASRGAGGFHILGIAIPALADAGLLSLPERDAGPGRDGAAHDVYVVMRRVDVDRTECVNAVANIDRDANGGLVGFEILGAIDIQVDGQSVLESLRSGASGTPVETGEVS